MKTYPRQEPGRSADESVGAKNNKEEGEEHAKKHDMNGEQETIEDEALEEKA
jgi:hypothetical protein